MIHPVLKKLNAKEGYQIHVVNLPNNLKPLIAEWQSDVAVKTKIGKEKIVFALAFCTTQQEVNRFAEELNAVAEGDALLWFCYPKGTSKNYKCDFNRDTGWKRLGELGWEPVRQVAIDEDWSALRFRKADFIKTMTRSFAMTEKGKQKVANNKSDKTTS